jgi:hypothetical protein
MVGAVVSSAAAVFIGGPILGAVLACHAALARDSVPDGRTRGRAVLWAWLSGVVLVPYAAGAVFLGVVGGLVTLALLVVVAATAVSAIREVDPEAVSPDRGVPEEAAPSQPVSLRPTGDFVALMPTGKLLEEWRRSEADLRCGDRRRSLAAVELRELVLDELCRRHPDALDLLGAGRGTNPPRHPHDDSGLAR